MSGGHRLTLVPTPIGNLDDITLRALDVLRHADVVAAEDTRRSRTLLDRHGIATPLVRLDAHTIAARAPALLREHRHVAYVTDAGTPGISDPGADLVRLALEGGAHVEALPGPTAFVPALVLSGLHVHRFAFEGFLPRSGRARRERLAAVAARDHATALYESPHRLLATLRELAAGCGPGRRAAVARELSKRFEEVRRGTLEELVASFEETPPRGEVVVVVDGAPDAPAVRPAGGLRAAATRGDRDGDAGTFAHDARPPGTEDEAAELAAELAGEGLRGTELRAALLGRGVPRPLAYRLSVRYKRGDAGREG